jgi:hypothetical protein
MSGFGGAGAFSDGKYNITNNFGGTLHEYIGKARALELMHYVDDINMAYGGEGTKLFTTANSRFKKLCLQNKLNLLDASVRHLGTDINYVVLNNIYNELKDKVEFHFNTHVERIEIVADNELAVRKELVEGIRKVTRWGVKLKEISHLEYSGLSKLTFIPENELSVQFAVCTSAKEKVNGDNLNIVKISDTKYFVAIADGMGHGKNANKISKMVLDLVMSMFSVGMDLDLIIETVNKLLLPVGLDNFSTLDACVVDLNENVATFIKLGSSVSILKHKMTSEEIVCKSLPVGIVQNIKPTITQKRLVDGDVIFLASDGVVDAFGDVQKYKNFINDAKIINLQCYIDTVMADIEASNPKHPDDMSIIAVKLLKNSVK